jgi:hypothetical protein
MNFEGCSMPEQTFKGEEAKKWLLDEGRKHWWIRTNFRKIHILRNEAYHPLWRIIYLPIELQGGLLEGKYLGDYLDGRTDTCDICFDPNGVQTIYFSRSRFEVPEIEEAGEADSHLCITLRWLIVELTHAYYKKSFGRLGYAESLTVRINPEGHG